MGSDGWEICGSRKNWWKLGPQISIFRIAPFSFTESSLNLCVLLLHLSRVFCANLAPERPVLDPSLLGPLVKSHGQLSSVHVEHVIKAVAHSSARLRLCGRTVGLVAQTVFRQNLSLGEDLEGVLFLTGLATLDRAVRSHTHTHTLIT